MTTSSASVWQQILDDLRRKPMVLGALLVLATLLLYMPVAHHAFLEFDDSQYITKNDHVRTGLSLDNVVWAFKDVDTFYWHPVTWLSHMTDCQLFGLNSGAHHLVNVGLHIANVLLLFFLLRSATGAIWRSFIVAAIFALHPLNVETIAWLAERKSLLSAFFSLLTFAAYGWYAKQPGWKRYFLVAAGFLLALMSKPMAVTLPLLLLLFDLWPLNRYAGLPFAQRWVRLCLEKAPLLMMSIASSAVTVVGHRSAMLTLSALPLASRLQNAIICYAAYVFKIIWPGDLSSFYPLPAHSPRRLLAAMMCLLVITALVVRFRCLRYPIVGWSLFVLTLLPVIGIVQVGRVAMADRFSYIPAIGIFVIVVWTCGHIVESLRIPRVVPLLATLLVLVACATASRYYLQFWHDSVTLFTHARLVAERPDFMIEEGLADSLLAAGQVDEAFSHYKESCNLDPNLDLCHYNMAEILFTRNSLSEAVEEYQRAAILTGDRGIELSCLINAADALITMGDYNSAGRALSMALQVDPGNDNAKRLLARLPR